ncbi:hypothetical protein AAFC00_005487 [Neodothiora populina]|uniref:non-specific serine/threonine protein kinase n=1 Tax=Neodothiora populina TaxID=2781224 RepID=A0ABR3PM48_9PEZI
MSTAASPSSTPHTPSSVRRHQSYVDRDRYQATPTRDAAPSSPRRSLSQSQVPSHSREPSAQGQLSSVARRDFEQSNVAHPPSDALPDDSREPPPSFPARSDSTRQPSMRNGNGQHSRYNSQDIPQPAAPPPANANGSANNDPSHHTSSSGVRRRTTIDATTGHWELGKTIGAGSMGKVKLARNKETGEQVAVKIVPRLSTDEHRTPQDRERADHSKEVRTAREAAIVTLVDHPYICGMRDVVRTNYHWYMLFEYVNGGQMLDYIISHGRLKEKQARKFGRQIASALDYCHRNSIVHRDLKIENILISKTGDIKIIDFGLSNTFSPKSLLKTFCGSLYFAAPELLQAKAYVGPEVDVWSFGIVLYVLVCGKVPFDDQSMPQLHAKIKKGVVEYPPWLSTECKSLIGRMLVTDPNQRAPLSEIMAHPWMTKGFGGPPESYLPPRKPLQLPLDPLVLQKMDGFDFGSADVIEQQLTDVLRSDEYQRAVVAAERRNQMPTPEVEKKRGVFDFYKRRNSTTSRETLSGASSEAVQLGADPLNAYHPLISIYFLAKEKLEREQRESNPGALSIPSSISDKTPKLPELRAPQAAYTNTSTYEMAGEKPTGGRSRPRARTHGEDEVADDLSKLKINNRQVPPSPAIVLPPPDQTPTRKEGMATGILRRFSTRKHREPDRPTASQPDHSTPRKSFSMRRQRDRDSSATGLRPDVNTNQPPELLTPPQPSSEPQSRRVGLGRSTSVSTAEQRRRTSRRGVSEGASGSRPPMPPQYGSRRGNAADRPGDAASDVESPASRSAGPTSRTKSVGHARKESYQARRVARGYNDTDNVPEETDQDLQADMAGNNVGGTGSSPQIKPVYLKGLFSVSTTSSKPLAVIRADIIRTLKQLNVEYREIKGGFNCRHAPSIDLHKNHDEGGDRGLSAQPSHKRKISFGGFMTSGSNEREHDARNPSTPTMPSRRPENSYIGSEEESDDSEGASAQRARRRLSAQGRPPGETSTHVQSDLGSSMVLKFEIFVVKVPILNIHGIQFKKVDGGTWQYKNMAQTILNELRL